MVKTIAVHVGDGVGHIIHGTVLTVLFRNLLKSYPELTLFMGLDSAQPDTDFARGENCVVPSAVEVYGDRILNLETKNHAGILDF